MKALGAHTPVPEHYAPEVLEAIPRSLGRAALGLESDVTAFHGEDVWHAWELSWRNGNSVRSAVGRLVLPCSSPNLVESKSLKLYLNSLHREQFASEEALSEQIRTDLSAVAGAPVAVEILPLESNELAISTISGVCIDGLEPAGMSDRPEPGLLAMLDEPGRQRLYSNSLRSLCPVTAQPDWATLIVEVEGSQLEPASLLAYVLGFSSHQEFHEQCVERVYKDIRTVCAPSFLSVQALYTRRGGLDINPWRCSEPGAAPRLRTSRQ